MRTACMATRWNVALTVVNSPATSYSVDWRNTCSAHALSLPLLQLSQVFLRMVTTKSCTRKKYLDQFLFRPAWHCLRFPLFSSSKRWISCYQLFRFKLRIFLKTVLNDPFLAQQRPLKHNFANDCSSTHILLDCNHAGRVQRFF